MEIFILTLNQMFFLFLCILLGYFANKKHLFPENADAVISKLENYIVIPCLVLSSFYNNCSIESLATNIQSILYSTIYLVINIAIAVFLAPVLSKDKYEQGIYRYSLVITNLAFTGNAMVSGIFGDEMLYKYLMFNIPTTLFIYAVGILWLTNGQKKFNIKMLVNPVFFFMIAGILLGIIHPPLPLFITNTLSGITACFSPLAMILTGFVIAKFNIKELFKIKKIYLVILIRMILLPISFLYLFRILGVDNEIIQLMALAACMPLSINTIIYPAAYEKDTKLGAGMAVISNLVGLITIPVYLVIALGPMSFS